MSFVKPSSLLGSCDNMFLCSGDADGWCQRGDAESVPVIQWVATARVLLHVAHESGPCAFAAMLKFRVRRLSESDICFIHSAIRYQRSSPRC